MAKERIDTTFHETFALNVPAVAAVLRVCKEHEGDVTLEIIAAETTLGPNYVKAMPRYARGCGLLEMGGYSLSAFGKAVLKGDPNLTHGETLWLMHYHLSAPQGPGPSFWNHLITSVLRVGESAGRPEICEALKHYFQAPIGKTLSTRTIESTATAFLGTYAKSDGLGPLGILATPESSRGIYDIVHPLPPRAWTLAYALADFWDNFTDGTEMLLKELGRADGFAGLFFMGSGMLGTLLADLQTSGVVDIKRDAPPFVVTKLWESREELLNRVYG